MQNGIQILVPGMTPEQATQAALGYAVKVSIDTTAKGQPVPSVEINGMDVEGTIKKALDSYNEMRRKLGVTGGE